MTLITHAHHLRAFLQSAAESLAQADHVAEFHLRRNKYPGTTKAGLRAECRMWGIPYSWEMPKTMLAELVEEAEAHA